MFDVRLPGTKNSSASCDSRSTTRKRMLDVIEAFEDVPMINNFR